MAGRSLSSDYSGIHLTHYYDDLLHKISGYFTEIDRVNSLAIQLFLGSATGGEAFVAQLEKDSTPANKAFKVLDGWRTRYYEKACGGYLYEVLKMPEVNPVAAMECKSQLCPLNPAEESETATTSSPQTKQPRPGGVNAVWTSSSGRFAVILDEKLSSKIPNFDLSSPLTGFFKGLLGNTGHVNFLEKSEDMLQLMCVSVGVKLDSDFTAKQLKESLTSPLASYVGLPPSRLQCHRVIPSKFGSVKCVYSLPMKKADSLLQKWSDAEKAQELQEVFSELPALITANRPISSITGTLDEALWEVSTHWANPSQPSSTTFTNSKPTAEKRLYESTCGPQEIASSSSSLASESSTQAAKRRNFDHSAEQQQQEALNEALESQTPTTSSPKTKQACAVWTSSSGRFAVTLNEELSLQIPDVDLSSPLTDFFKELLGNTGDVSFLDESEDMLHLICMSVGVKLDSDFTAEQLKQRLTSPLAGYIGLPPSLLSCHKVIPSKLNCVNCVYSLPTKNAKNLLQKWLDVGEAQKLQEIFSDLPALIRTSRPVSSITDTIDDVLWGISTHPANPPPSSSTSLANEASTLPAKRRKFDYSAEGQQQETLDEEKLPAEECAAVPLSDESDSSFKDAAQDVEPMRAEASHLSQTISADTMITVASCMPNLQKCKALAAKLKFSVLDIMEIRTFDSNTAQSILEKWYARELESATGQVLCDALWAIGMQSNAWKISQ